MKINITEAKAKLSALVKAALRGEGVVLAKLGRPVARIAFFLPTVPRTRHILARSGYPDLGEDWFRPEPDIAAALDRCASS